MKGLVHRQHREPAGRRYSDLHLQSRFQDRKALQSKGRPQNFGLGFRLCASTFALDTLGVQLPRLDVDRREALNICQGLTSAGEKEVADARRFLEDENTCQFNWQSSIPTRSCCFSDDAGDDTSCGTLLAADPHFRAEAVADLEDDLFLAPGCAAAPHEHVAENGVGGLEDTMGEMHLVTPTDLNCPLDAGHGIKLQPVCDEGQRESVQGTAISLQRPKLSWLTADCSPPAKPPAARCGRGERGVRWESPVHPER